MDEARRAAERQAASGDVEARAQVLRLRVRTGDLRFERLRLAARLGDPAARAAAPDVQPVDGVLLQRFPDPFARAARVVLERLDAPWGRDTGALLGALTAVTRDDRLATRLFTLDRPIACPMCKRPGPSPLNAWPQPATWPDLGPAVEPLARDSPRWAELDHAGGAGSDVPDLLRRLEQGDAAAWEQLDPGVHHEVDVRESTYAAIPHIVRIAERAGSRADLGYLAKVVVSIRRAGRRPAGRFRADQVRPEPDAQLVRACEQAVARARARCLVDTLARLDGALGRSDLEIAGVLCGAVDDRHVVGHTANGGLTLFCGEGQHDFYVRFQGDDAVQVTL